VCVSRYSWVVYTGWQWRNFDPYLCQLVFAAIFWVKIWEMFATVISLKTLCWQASDHTDIFVNQRIEFYLNITRYCALSVLTLLVGRQEEHPACKRQSGGVLTWLSVWSKVQTCIWPSWCHCHSLSLASEKSRLILPFWYRLTWVVPEKRPLNVCVCVCV